MRDVKTAWAITHWKDGVYLHTIAPFRREAIEIFRMNYGPIQEGWHPCSPDESNRAVKVSIKIEPANTRHNPHQEGNS